MFSFYTECLFAETYEDKQNNRASNVIARDLYVDNVISSFEQQDELLEYFDQSRKLLKDAGMNLWSWSSNNAQLRTRASDENVLDTDDVTKVLEMRWKPQTYMISSFCKPQPTGTTDNYQTRHFEIFITSL
jgi:hypothetical protein